MQSPESRQSPCNPDWQRLRLEANNRTTTPHCRTASTRLQLMQRVRGVVPQCASVWFERVKRNGSRSAARIFGASLGTETMLRLRASCHGGVMLKAHEQLDASNASPLACLPGTGRAMAMPAVQRCARAALSHALLAPEPHCTKLHVARRSVSARLNFALFLHKTSSSPTASDAPSRLASHLAGQARASRITGQSLWNC